MRSSVHDVRRLCERPGCAGQAEVSYGIDHVSLVVWVDNKAISEREMAGRLCRRHANALVVPRGWTVDDRRDAVPKLFRTVEDDMPVSKPRPKKSAPVRETSESPSLFEEAPAAVAPVIDPDETQAIPWLPRLAAKEQVEPESKQDDEPVFGRLLGRAFGQKK
jgi:hypothetical protein